MGSATVQKKDSAPPIPERLWLGFLFLQGEVSEAPSFIEEAKRDGVSAMDAVERLVPMVHRGSFAEGIKFAMYLLTLPPSQKRHVTLFLEIYPGIADRTTVELLKAL